MVFNFINVNNNFEKVVDFIKINFKIENTIKKYKDKIIVKYEEDGFIHEQHIYNGDYVKIDKDGSLQTGKSDKTIKAIYIDNNFNEVKEFMYKYCDISGIGDKFMRDMKNGVFGKSYMYTIPIYDNTIQCVLPKEMFEPYFERIGNTDSFKFKPLLCKVIFIKDMIPNIEIIRIKDFFDRNHPSILSEPDWSTVESCSVENSYICVKSNRLIVFSKDLFERYHKKIDNETFECKMKRCAYGEYYYVIKKEEIDQETEEYGIVIRRKIEKYDFSSNYDYYDERTGYFHSLKEAEIFLKEYYNKDSYVFKTENEPRLY